MTSWRGLSATWDPVAPVQDPDAPPKAEHLAVPAAEHEPRVAADEDTETPTERAISVDDLDAVFSDQAAATRPARLGSSPPTCRRHGQRPSVDAAPPTG